MLMVMISSLPGGNDDDDNNGILLCSMSDARNDDLDHDDDDIDSSSSCCAQCLLLGLEPFGKMSHAPLLSPSLGCYIINIIIIIIVIIPIVIIIIIHHPDGHLYQGCVQFTTVVSAQFWLLHIPPSIANERIQVMIVNIITRAQSYS